MNKSLNKNLVYLALSMILIILSLELFYVDVAEAPALEGLLNSFPYLLFIIGIVLAIGGLVLLIISLRFLMQKTSKSSISNYLYKQSNKGLETVKKDITVLYCNISNFSALAANLTLDENYKFINEYYDKLGEVITQNGGVIENRLNDAILAYFGVVYSDNKHPLNAAKSAIQILEIFEGIKNAWMAKSKEPIDIKIGMNTDLSIVGVIGSKYYPGVSSVGDCVNLAIRICLLNKEKNTRILLTRNTYEKINALFELQSQGMIKLKGKPEQLEIFELQTVKLK